MSKTLGAGFLEKVYERALLTKLSLRVGSYSAALFRYGGVEHKAERRKESRLKTNQPVTLALLSVSIGLPSRVFEACVLDVSGSGLRVRTPGPIPCGALVRVDAKEMLMLGEVCRCELENGAYAVGIKLSHSLAALGELEKLNHALMGGRLSGDLASDAGLPARGTVRTRS